MFLLFKTNYWELIMETISKSNQDNVVKKIYGLTEYQFQLVQHLMQIDEKEKLAFVQNLDSFIDDRYMHKDEMLERLNLQLQLFNKVYQEQSDFYDSMFTGDFDIITQILHDDKYILTKYQDECDELNKQQNKLNILLKEIQELQPNKVKQSEDLAQKFYSTSHLSQSPFAHYSNINQKINDNDQIIKSLKEIRFDCAFK